MALQAILALLLGWSAGMAVLAIANLLISNKMGIELLFTAPPRQRWIVGIIYACSASWLWFGRSSPAEFVIDLALLLYFGVVWIVDQQTHLIPNMISLAGLMLGLVSGAWRNGMAATLVGGLVGFCLSLGLFVLGIGFMALMSRLRGKSSQEPAFGFGDVLLSGVIGLMVGWPLILNSLLLTILLSGLFSLFYLALKLLTRKYSFGLALPYAPFLVLGALFYLFIQPALAG